MTVSAARKSREIVFAPRIADLFRRYRGESLFRLEPDTVGVAGAGLMDRLLLSRRANAEERPTFKPVLGRHITKTESATLMRAVGADVRAALGKPPGEPDLTGSWPQVPHNYLRDLVFGAERLRFRMLVDRRLELTPKLTWSAVTWAAALFGRPAPEVALSSLARLVLEADSFADRRFAMYLYRRVAGPVCFTVAALVTNALWLGAPFAGDVPDEYLLNETLRLLPPSWNILRRRSPEFTAVDSRIGPRDDVLLLPLLSHRDPALWEAPDEFRPERWAELDPDTHPGYLPFGHATERCWGRHMVLPLAARLLALARRDGLTVDPRQAKGRVHLDGLLEVSGVRVVRS
ncbi:cytochrome P450 [Amycolatopsis rhizosphaerae]|uniref:Cytochrome P450 n=1 Tax=Amycolatopsis rhizosphaerae TaxID=2053003 RepID=A0A557ZYP5_9PSEU|nr:cytochrome P450 [Amycolatopsis rhizosphaerae]TVT17111.1 cytochrome P450 [Amycolatopsis rhizosphaerae]